MVMKTLVCRFTSFHTEGEDGPNYVYGDPKFSRRNAGSIKDYHYAYDGPKDTKVGDWALVHNGSDFGLCEVIGVLPGLSQRVTKYVILTCTKEEFEQYREANKSLQQRKDDYKMLDYMVEQTKSHKKYADLAGNPEAQVIMDRLGISVPAIEGKAEAEVKAE